MTGGVVNIGYVELVGASLLMLVAGIVSWRMGLGQTRRIAVSTVRAFLQLLAMGLLLGYLFKYQTWWLVCLVLLGIETVIWLIWGRCPHCHALIWRQHGDYCQMCGKNLYEEDER